jgi:hypothetical protein
MNNDRVQSGRRDRKSAGERAWRLLAVGVAIGGLALLGAFGGLGFGLSGLGSSAASVARSLEAVVRTPGRNGPPPLGPGWRHTPVDAVQFDGGYFCAEGPDGRRIARLVLASRELDTLAQGSSSVVGPFSSKARTRGAC